MTVTPLHRTPGDQMLEQLDRDTLQHACVVYFDAEGNLQLMLSDIDIADIAYAGTMLQAVAAQASLGAMDYDD